MGKAIVGAIYMPWITLHNLLIFMDKIYITSHQAFQFETVNTF